VNGDGHPYRIALWNAPSTPASVEGRCGSWPSGRFGLSHPQSGLGARDCDGERDERYSDSQHEVNRGGEVYGRHDIERRVKKRRDDHGVRPRHQPANQEIVEEDLEREEESAAARKSRQERTAA
jgi:hypothetical protein